MNDKTCEYWCRIETQVTVSSDEYGELTRTGMRVNETHYRVLSKTPKGVWLARPGDTNRWVSNTSAKRFAHPTVEEAKAAYNYRKKYYINILKARISSAEEGMRLVNSKVYRALVHRT